MTSLDKLVRTRYGILSLQLYLLLLGHYELETAYVDSFAAALSPLTTHGEWLVRAVTH